MVSSSDRLTKSGHSQRWTILTLSCLLMIGAYFCYDNPAALNESLQEHFSSKLSPSQYQFYFNLLYSVYSLPNIFLPFLFGYFIDVIGPRTMLLILNAFLVVGQTVFWAGCASTNMSLMLTGRVFFGIGGESLNVAITVVLMQYFKGKESCLALALNLCVARGGSVLNDLLSPVVAESLGVSNAILLGVLLLACGLLCTIVVNTLDRKIEKRLEEQNRERSIAPEEVGEKTNLADVLKFSPLFWTICWVCVVVYACILPFNNIASGFLVEEWYASLPPAEARQRAGRVMSIIFAFSAVASPAVGYLSDKLGQRARTCSASALLLICAHWMLLHVTPEIPMVMIGLAYTMFASVVWPCVGLAVEDSQQGSAYGLTTSFQNAGLFLMPLLVAYLRAQTGRYVAVQYLFMSTAAIGFGITLLLNMLDSRSGGVLNKVQVDEAEDKCAKETSPLMKHDLTAQRASVDSQSTTISDKALACLQQRYSPVQYDDGCTGSAP
eukprot:GDKI01006874.1.p1 GENE.GDKI01006874.1~~GDKI01006874.1.p1  ORF type:complete len:495 (-),score=113.00 GDKI01006874.1:147-1631(-)